VFRVAFSLFSYLLSSVETSDNADELYRHIGDEMVKEKGYFATSCLQRNW